MRFQSLFRPEDQNIVRTTLQSQRQVLAWILLLALCMQRIVGYVGRDVVHVALIEMSMDEEEQEIARQIKSDIGLNVYIRILGDKQLSQDHQSGYSAPFIVSLLKEHQVRHYSLSYMPDSTLNYTYLTTGQQDVPIEHIPQRPLSERLYSYFYFWNIKFPSSWDIQIKAEGGFSHEMLCLFHLEVDTPPPEFSISSGLV